MNINLDILKVDYDTTKQHFCHLKQCLEENDEKYGVLSCIWFISSFDNPHCNISRENQDKNYRCNNHENSIRFFSRFRCIFLVKQLSESNVKKHSFFTKENIKIFTIQNKWDLMMSGPASLAVISFIKIWHKKLRLLVDLRIFLPICITPYDVLSTYQVSW